MDDVVAKRLLGTQGIAQRNVSDMQIPGAKIFVLALQIDVSPALHVPVVRPEIQDAVAPHVPVITPNYEDVTAPQVPVITPETRPAFEELLENRLRLADRADTEHGRVTTTGQRVEVGERSTSGIGSITIEKIEIHASSENSAREIAREVLKEFENMMRNRNF